MSRQFVANSRLVICAAAIAPLAMIALAAAAESPAELPLYVLHQPAGLRAAECNTPTTPFCDALMKPTPGWTGHVFKLSQNYPKTAPKESYPWMNLNPRTLDYLNAVLKYFYEGNIRPDVESSFDPTLNKVRAWYNSPWQDYGLNGREFVHGLTRERVSLPLELSADQTSNWNNYAVGFYNAPGGYIIGRVWADHGAPDAVLAKFPDGTVAAKLLFTTATVQEVPYLAGAPEWNAYIYKEVHKTNPELGDPRDIVKVRLLQIDIAVRDSRVNGTTGWVMGTYVYGGGPTGKYGGSGWENVSPVGIMWGNDPTYSGTGPLAETVLNDAVKMPHVGYQGRLNGPVDNPISACLSCHGTAEVAPPTVLATGSGMTPPKTSKWFQNIKSGEAFDKSYISTDYSLQLAVGINNFKLNQTLAASGPGPLRATLEVQEQQLEAVPPRDGAPID